MVKERLVHLWVAFCDFRVRACHPLVFHCWWRRPCPLHHLIYSRKEAQATAWSRLLTWTTPWGEASSWPSVPKSTKARRPRRPASLSYIWPWDPRCHGRKGSYRVHASPDAARLRGRGRMHADLLMHVKPSTTPKSSYHVKLEILSPRADRRRASPWCPDQLTCANFKVNMEKCEEILTKF